jgi:hypothetical protein
MRTRQSVATGRSTHNSWRIWPLSSPFRPSLTLCAPWMYACLLLVLAHRVVWRVCVVGRGAQHTALRSSPSQARALLLSGRSRGLRSDESQYVIAYSVTPSHCVVYRSDCSTITVAKHEGLESILEIRKDLPKGCFVASVYVLWCLSLLAHSQASRQESDSLLYLDSVSCRLVQCYDWETDHQAQGFLFSSHLYDVSSHVLAQC